MNIEVSESELKDLTIELCTLGESRGYPPDQFAIMLSMIAKHLCDAQGIEVNSVRKMNA